MNCNDPASSDTSSGTSDFLPAPREDAQRSGAESEASLHRRVVVGGIVAAGAAFASVANAGPLNPPPGPIAPTHKTLTDLEPRTLINATNTPGDAGAVFVISQPGAYYLPAGLTVPAGKIGIRIASDDVTIDLNGMSIVGGGAGSSGITDQGTEFKNIVIRNGALTGLGGIAIFLLSAPYRLSDLAIRSNTGAGILTGGGAGRVNRVNAVANNSANVSGHGGIVVGGPCIVTDCEAASNTGKGIGLGAYSQAVRCSASGNTRIGIEAGTSCAVIDCASSGNGQAGISCQLGCLVEGCAVSTNTGFGITTTFGAAVLNTAASNNLGGGFSTGEGCLLSRCAANNNTGHGFSPFTGNLLNLCLASFNSLNGFDGGVATGSAFIGCVARGNGGNGATVGNLCTVLENLCDSNGVGNPNTAGIQITGQRNRVVRNHTVANAHGFWVTGQRNVIVENTSAINSISWNIGLHCSFGPIVDRTSPMNSGMSGNGTVASTMGTIDPFANFSL